MIYLTKANFAKFITHLDLNIPFHYREEYSFYQGYKLKDFRLAMNYCTLPEAKALVLCDMLCRDSKNFMNNLMLKNITQDQDKWVYKISNPCYHLFDNCVALNSDFTNVSIPQSLDKNKIEAYRSYYKENVNKYGYKENLIEPRVFARKLIEKFNLAESIRDMEKEHLHFKQFDNSDVTEFEQYLDFNQEKQDIAQLITEFEDLVKNMMDKTSRQAYQLEKQEKEALAQEECIENFFSPEEMEVLEAHKKKRALVKRMLNFYYQKLNLKGLEIGIHLLDIMGFAPCPLCQKERNHAK